MYCVKPLNENEYIDNIYIFDIMYTLPIQVSAKYF